MWDVRYRPLKFTDVLGQDGTVQVLKSRLKRGTATDTSYIFAGGHGQGKTTLARIFARAVLCQDRDPEVQEPCNQCDNCLAFLSESSPAFREMDAASNGTIDVVRGIVDELDYAVYGSDIRLYLFDEAHRMGVGAQDVLLKPIENKRMVCILCTTELVKIRGPIRSRCESYIIRRIGVDEVLVRMRMILETEGIPYEDDAVRVVIDHCDGHVRDVVNKLEMIAQLGAVNLEAVRESLDLGLVPLYYDTLLALTDPPRAVELVERLCERVVPDEVSAGLAEAAMNVYRIFKGMSVNWSVVDRAKAQQVYQQHGEGVIRLSEHFLGARHSTRTGLVCDVLTATRAEGRAPAVVLVPATMLANTPATPPAVAPVATSSPVSGTSPVPVTKPVNGKSVGLWEGDHIGVSSNMPKTSRSKSTANPTPRIEPRSAITPAEWRVGFMSQWKTRAQ